jgi:hypothetical protein
MAHSVIQHYNHLLYSARHHLVTKPHRVQMLASAQWSLSSKHRHLHILFRHPGYDDGNNALFKLHVPNTDKDEQTLRNLQSMLAS